MTNSSSSINVLMERGLVMPPQSGFHMSFFANYTLDGVTVTVAISVVSWPVLNDRSPFTLT